MTAKEGEFTDGVVVVKPGTDAEAIAKKIDALGFYGETRSRTFEAEARAFEGVVNIIKTIAYALGGVLVGLACGLILSTISRIVADSRADIGLFRALGATKRDIRRLFLGESMLLGTMGTFAGMALGWVLAAGISHWVIAYSRRETFDPEELLLVPQSIFAVDAKFCALLLVAAAGLSFLAGLWPANRAAAVDPVKALKRE